MVTNFPIAQILITVGQMNFEKLKEIQNPKSTFILKFILLIVKIFC